VALVLGEVEKTDPVARVRALALGETEDPSRLDQGPVLRGRPAATSTRPLGLDREVEDRVPPVLPLIDLTGGMQVIDRTSTWSGGWSSASTTYTYAGTSLGV
jgi:hypothetical protein